MEVEEMINKVREQQGRPFDVKQLITSCVANVVMNMLFGHRFDHCDPAFRQLISDIECLATKHSTVLQIFPLLRFLPHFKKNIAEHHRTLKKVFSFIYNSIATSIQVCVCSFFCLLCKLIVAQFAALLRLLVRFVNSDTECRNHAEKRTKTIEMLCINNCIILRYINFLFYSVFCSILKAFYKLTLYARISR